ncbi:MAG TPA: GNAT family N-acetyltransferase [Bryobacteraceae bacterium]|nr:GNAT family N-acetyltransferase [Bryobacteraceae bacterium]
MSGEPLVRTATEADITAITGIYSYYVHNSAATFETDPPGAEEMVRHWSELTGRGFPYIVADLDGQVSGYAYASPWRARPAYRYTVEDSVYVHRDFAGRGLGRLLLSRLIELCGARGYRQMIAVIGGRGNAASIRLHETSGFRRVGVLEEVGFKFGGWIDTVLMQLSLIGTGILE